MIAAHQPRLPTVGRRKVLLAALACAGASFTPRGDLRFSPCRTSVHERGPFTDAFAGATGLMDRCSRWWTTATGPRWSGYGPMAHATERSHEWLCGQ